MRTGDSWDSDWDYDDGESVDEWSKIKYNNKERAKMILNEIDNDADLEREFNALLRQRKIEKIKSNVLH